MKEFVLPTISIVHIDQSNTIATSTCAHFGTCNGFCPECPGCTIVSGDCYGVACYSYYGKG